MATKGSNVHSGDLSTARILRGRRRYRCRLFASRRCLLDSARRGGSGNRGTAQDVGTGFSCLAITTFFLFWVFGISVSRHSTVSPADTRPLRLIDSLYDSIRIGSRPSLHDEAFVPDSRISFGHSLDFGLLQWPLSLDNRAPTYTPDHTLVLGRTACPSLLEHLMYLRLRQRLHRFTPVTTST